MDRERALRAFDRERRELDVGGFRRVASAQLVRHVPIEPGDAPEGFVSFSRHSEAEIGGVVEEVVAAFAAQRCAFEWKVFEHDQPTDLVERLRRAGFAIGEAEALVVLPIADAGALLTAELAHRVERVGSPEQLRDYLAVAGAVWGGVERLDWIERELRERPDEIALYVAYAGDAPAASARASFTRGSAFAGLWTGATLPEHRRQGLYTDLVRARAREAAARGFEYLMVDALPTSSPTLGKLGFERLSASRPCRWRERA